MEGGEENYELVAILDAGAQYGKVIDRRIRELNVKTVILPLETSAEDLLLLKNLKGLVISGGGGSVNDSAPIPYDSSLFSLGVPVLGICYGLHLIVKHFGGQVVHEQVREDGQFEVLLEPKGLFDGLETKQQVLLTHGDSVKKVPDCLKVIGMSGDLVTAVCHVTEPIYGVQFHPEVDLTQNGQEMMKNFLYKVCQCEGSFHLENREVSCIQHIQKVVGDTGHVLSFVSGGIDSTVCTVLILKALGPERITAVHIDNGFLRKNEAEEVMASLKQMGINAKVKKAGLTFSTAVTQMDYRDMDGCVHRRNTPFLNSVVNSEEKRHIIGDTFARIATEILHELGTQEGHRRVFLAQGTLRPDLIESASRLVSTNAQVIKTHHNDTALIRKMRDRGLIIEPLSEFHKDEVRQLGVALGLPGSIIQRHPFPGPGLAIRVICQDEAYLQSDFVQLNTQLETIASYAQAVTKTDSIRDCLDSSEEQFLIEFTSHTSLSAMTLPIYSVGVQGDARSFKYVAVLSSDEESNMNWSSVITMAKLIPKICHSINRVVWAFGGRIYAPISDVTPTHLTTGVLATLREADSNAHAVLASHGLLRSISQMPVILIPIHFDRNYHELSSLPSCQRSVVIRPFITSDFMTGIPAIPGDHIPLQVIDEMIQQIRKVPGISRVLYDLTPKPPGTTEWE